MINIGIAADIDEVALVPAARVHVGTADGEELVAARTPGAGGCGLGMLGVGVARGLGFAVLLLLLALLALLAALVVLSVLRLFCHGPSRC